MTDLKRAADLLRGIELVHADIADLGERGRVPVVGVERRGRVGNHVFLGGRMSYVMRARGAFLLGTHHRNALVAGALEGLNLRLVALGRTARRESVGQYGELSVLV